MNELVKIQSEQINGELVQTVNARDLHEFLGVGKDFSNWIKAQIKRARLVQDRDFVTVAQKGVGGKFAATEYHLTIASGKHVSMMAGTDKGFEIREYFIECESMAKNHALVQHASPAVRPELAATDIFKSFNEIGKLIGLDTNEAAFHANHATQQLSSVNILELMGVTRLLAPAQEANFTPTQLGRQMNPPRSPIQVNEMLVKLGYQKRTGVKKCPYEGTDKGKKFCRLHDEPRKHAAGISQGLRWYATILNQEDVRWAAGWLAE